MKLWPRALPRPLRFHDLRHTHATLLLRAGVDAHRVQRLMRHRHLETTVKIYGHLDVEDLRAGVDFSFAGSLPPRVENAETESQRKEASSDTRLATRLLPEPEKASEQSAVRSENRPKYRRLTWRAMQDSNLRPLASERRYTEYPNSPESSRSVLSGTVSGDQASREIPQKPFLPADFGGSLLRDFSPGEEDGNTPSPPAICKAATLPTEPTKLMANLHAVEESLLSVRDVAAQLSVCRAVVYRIVAKKELAAVRIGSSVRISPVALGQYFSDQRWNNR